MGVLQQQRAQQALKIALRHLAAQARKEVPDLQVRLRRAAVQPALQRLDTEDQPLRIGAVVPLPQLEFQIGHGRLQLGAVNPLVRQTEQLVKKDPLHLRGVLRL